MKLLSDSRIFLLELSIKLKLITNFVSRETRQEKNRFSVFSPFENNNILDFLKTFSTPVVH